MTPESHEIRYQFHGAGEIELDFRVIIDAQTLTHRVLLAHAPPDWTALENYQCPGCTLDPAESPQCPPALSLVPVVEQSGRLLSYSEVDVTVTAPERVFRKRTTVQRALSSLIGLLMATSGCPKLALLKPMARFHLPFATREETLYRTVCAYLLRQFFAGRNGGGTEAAIDLEGLRKAYEGIQHVNRGMAQRLRGITPGDANINAIVVLDLFAQEVPLAITAQLDALAYLFETESSARAEAPEAAPAASDSPA